MPSLAPSSVCQLSVIVALDRNVLGTKNLGDILSERESIALEMQVYAKYADMSKYADTANMQICQICRYAFIGANHSIV